MKTEMNGKNHRAEIQENPNYMDPASAQRISFSDIKEHMTGPVVSIVAHIIIFSIIASIVVFSPPPEREEIDVSLEKITLPDIKEIPKPPDIKIEDIVSPPIEKDEPVISREVEVTTDDAFTNTAEDFAPNTLNVKLNISAKVITNLTPYNKTPEGIKKGMKVHGAPKGSDLIVQKGLRWLRDHQNQDGSWGEDKNRLPAFTGMALLAFLGHGETPSSPEFGACVLKAIKKLIKYSEASDPVRECAGNGYGHPIVTYALSEAYGLCKIPILEKSMDRMIEFTVKGQNGIGGYNYFYKNEEGRCDSSVIGWCSQALKAAFVNGSSVPGIEAAIEKTVQCLKIQQKTGRGFVYSTMIGKPADKQAEGGAQVTAAGTLTLQLLGEGKSPEAEDGIALILEKYNWCDWKGNEKDGGLQWALYRWYYQTQVLFQAFNGKKAEWKTWNKMFTSELFRNQRPDGHWETPASELAVSKNQKPDGHGEASFKGLDNGIYSTSLCTMILEIYYKFLPTYNLVDAKNIVSKPDANLPRLAPDLLIE